MPTITARKISSYRVEVHTPGAAAEVPTVVEVNRGERAVKAKAISGATFKWSRENGSVTFPIVGPISTGDGQTTLTLADLGRDDRFGLSAGNRVEIQDDDYVLRNLAGTLLQVQSIDRSKLQVTLTGTADSALGADPSKHPLLRRWDHQAGDPAEGGLTLGPDNAAFIQESDGDFWLALEDGVEIQFEPAAPGKPQQYRTGRLLADSSAHGHRRCGMAYGNRYRCPGQHQRHAFGKAAAWHQASLCPAGRDQRRQQRRNQALRR